jgi:hypothetical protein
VRRTRGGDAREARDAGTGESDAGARQPVLLGMPALAAHDRG